MTRLDQLAGLLLDIVNVAVDERLAALGVQSHETTYSSTQLPPGLTSREHFAALCRRLGIGRKEGRVWIVTESEWRRARTKVRATETKPVDSVDRDLANAGLRLVGRSK